MTVPKSMGPEDLRAVSALLDEALDLPPHERKAWLAALPIVAMPYRDTLREMLERAEAGTAAGLIGQLPAIDGESADPLDDLAVGRLINGYRLVRLIGRGGMGVVWLAERTDGLVGRQVALKLPVVAMPHRMLLQRFARERNILAALAHPHIARLYDAGVSESGQPYLVMEYVQGQPITDYCNEKKLSLSDRLRLFDQVLAAVQHAHANLVVHRDIKPANILVNEAGEVRLLDFGIAKLLGTDDTTPPELRTELTRQSGSPLTPDYASPEQIRLEPVGTASDIYSLGVLLYELASGERPYRLRGASAAQVEAAVLNEARKAPSLSVSDEAASHFGSKRNILVKQLRGDLDTVILKALKPMAIERYGSADAFAADLQRWRDGEPVRARPSSRWYRTVRFVSRNQLAVGLSGLVALSLVVGSGVALWQASVAQTEARISKAIESFVVGLFEANTVNQKDPLKARQTTASELLDLGAKRIGDSLNDAPEAKLRLLYTLANMYGDLNLSEPAVLLTKQMTALRQQLHPGPTLEHAKDLSDIVTGGGNVILPPQELRAYVNEAQSILEAHGDHSSMVYAQVMLAKAQVEISRPSWESCAQYASLAVDAGRQHPASVTLVDAMFTRASCISVNGDPALAASIAQEALTLIDGPVKSEYHRPLLKFLLSAMQRRMGQLEESIASATLALRAQDQNLGAQRIGQVEVLSEGLVAAARPKEALAALAPRLNWEIEHLDQAEKLNVMDTLDTRARILWTLGDTPSVLRDLHLVLRFGEEVENRKGGSAYFHETLAAVQEQQGRWSDAQCSLDWAVAHRLERHEEITSRINFSTKLQAQIYMRRGEWNKARAEMKKVWVEAARLDSANRADLERRMILGEIALGAEQWDEAWEFANDVTSRITSSSHPAHYADIHASALRARGLVNLQRGQSRAALAELQQAATIFTAVFDPNWSLELADTLRPLARAAEALGMREEAARYARQAHAIVQAHKASNKDMIGRCPPGQVASMSKAQ